MKSKIFGLIGLSILALVILAGVVSATGMDFDPTTISTLTDHNTDITFEFDLTHDGTIVNQTELNWTGSSTDVGSWKTLPTLTAINDGETKTLSAVLTIPKHSSGTNIDANIQVQSKTGTTRNLPIKITINSTPELSINSPTISTEDNETTITFTNDGNVDFSTVDISIEEIDGVTFTYNSSISNLIAGRSQDIDVGVDTSSSLDLGSSIAIVTATAEGKNYTDELTIEKTYCDGGIVGDDLDIVSVEDKSSGDEWEWAPLKDIKLKVVVDNLHPSDTKRVITQIGLYNVNDGKFVYLTEDDRELEDTIRIEDGRNEDFNFEFTLPADLDMDEDYRLYVKAYEKGDEDLLCASKTDFEGGNSHAFFQGITIETDDEVGVDGLSSFETVLCDSTHLVTFDLYNWALGDNEEMRVRIYNKELGIDLYSNQFELDEGDYEDLAFELNIPKNVEEGKTYEIKLIVEYNYRETSETYRDANSDNEFDLKVSGNCEVESTALVSPVLESGGKAGEKLVIKATITNTGAELVNYVLSATETDWASAVEFGETAIVLGAGESKDVLVTLDVNKDVSGDKVFNINVLNSDGELITKQPVSVLIEKSEGFNFEGLIQDNWYLWVIGAVNIILVIIIILVAVRVARK